LYKNFLGSVLSIEEFKVYQTKVFDKNALYVLRTGFKVNNSYALLNKISFLDRPDVRRWSALKSRVYSKSDEIKRMNL